MPLDLLAHTRFARGLESSPTNLGYLRNWGGVHPIFHVSQPRKCLRVPDEVVPTDTTFKILLSTKNILLEFWVETPKRPEAKLFLCARYNGAITLREKQHGRRSLTSSYDTLTSSKSTLRFNLEDEILLRG